MKTRNEGKMPPRSAHSIEVLQGPLDGEYSDMPAGCDTFEWNGHLYRIQREDTGAPFWLYAGYVLVGDRPQ